MPKSELRSYDDIQYSAAYKEKGSAGSLSPFTYLCAVLIIALLGLTVLYSSSYEKAIQLGLPHYYYFFRNLIAGISGLVIGILFRFIPLKAIRRGYIVLLPFSLLVLLVSLIPSLSADGWLVIAGSRVLSPASVAMLALPFCIAGISEERDGLSFSVIILPLFFSGLLMLLSLFSGGIAWYMMMLLALVVALRIKGMRVIPLLSVLIVFLTIGGAFCALFPERLLLPVTQSMLPADDSVFYNADLIASRSAIAEGGVAGIGLGKGLYKLGALAAPEGLFIFASFAEELGLTGTLVIFFLLLLISVIGIRTVSRSQQRGDSSSAVIVSGITIYIVVRSIVNISYAAGLLPLPGVLLPFFSYSPSEEFLTIFSSSLLYRLIFAMGRENEKR